MKQCTTYLRRRVLLAVLLSGILLPCAAQYHDPLMNAFFGATFQQPYSTPPYLSGWTFDQSYHDWLTHHDTTTPRGLMKPSLMKDTEYSESTDSSVTKRMVTDGVVGTKMIKDLAVPYTSIPLAGFSRDIDRINDELEKIDHWRNYIAFYGGSADDAKRWSDIRKGIYNALDTMTRGSILQPNYKRKDQLNKLYQEARDYRQELVAEIHYLYNCMYYTTASKNNKKIKRVRAASAVDKAHSRWSNAAFDAGHTMFMKDAGGGRNY